MLGFVWSRKAARLALVTLAAVPVLASAESAFAVPWLSDDQSTQRGAPFTSQQAPALASDPGNGQYLIAVSDGGTASGPKTALSYSSDGGVSWDAEPALMPHGAGVSGGSPSVAWLASSDDYPAPTAVVAERGNGPGGASCHLQGGIYLGTYGLGPSSGSWINGNAALVSADVPAAFTTSSAPAVAVYDPAGLAGTRIHVVYVRSTWADLSSCGTAAAPVASAIWLASSGDGGSNWSHSQVSPIADHAITPALDVRSDGNLVVVWDDRAQNAVRSRICSGQNGCADGQAPPAVVVDASAVGATLAGGLAVRPAPDVAVVHDLSDRVVVAWSEAAPTSGLDVMSATSHDGGLSFTAPVRANDDGAGAPQFGASLAASARGQVELAFLDARSGSLLPMASASRTPATAAHGEAWSSNVTLSQVPIDPVAAAPANAPQLSAHPISVASLALDFEFNGDPFPLPRFALAAWTDTGGGGARDAHAVVLRHGSTTPTLSAPGLNVGKGDLKALPLTIVDPDGDPVRTLLVTGPGASVPNENLPVVHYTAPHTTGVRSLRISLSDRTGSSSIWDVGVDVFNRPPYFVCLANQAVEQNKRLPIGACAEDYDPDTITYSVDTTAPGTVEHDSTGWYYKPEPGSVGRKSSFQLLASDGEATVALPVQLDVVAVPTGPQLKIAASTARAVRGSTVTFTAVASPKSASGVTWTFGDGKSDSGAEVRHRFTRSGSFTVRATIDGLTREVLIRIDPPPLELVSLKWKKGSLLVRVKIGIPGRVNAALGTNSRRSLQAGGVRESTLQFTPSRSRTRAHGHMLLVVRLTPTAKSANGIAGLKITRLVPVPARR